MYAAGYVFWSFQSALDERLVDGHLRRDFGKLASLPGFNLLFRMGSEFRSIRSRRSSLTTIEMRVCINVNRRQCNFKPDPV